MNDRVKLAREIATSTEPRFAAETRDDLPTDPKARARAVAALSEPRLLTIPRERGGSKVHCTEEQLIVMRGGLTVEEWRQKTIHKYGR